MFGKFAVITILTSLIFSIYLHQFQPEIFERGSLKVIELKKSFFNWVSCLDTESSVAESQQSIKLFTVEELKKYDGEAESKGLYLAILGKVYDVGSGEKHYGPGQSYHFFTGKDGSRAFVTGDFTEKGLIDDVLGLTPKEVKSILQWGEFYEKDYKYVGNLIGRYFDLKGQKTAYYSQVEELIEEASAEEEKENKVKVLFPPCNSEWSQETGSRVWCSKMSGGIERDWVGVPRQMYEPGSESYRCACLNINQPGNNDVNLAQIKEYPDCNPTAESCQIIETSDEEENEDENEEENEN